MSGGHQPGNAVESRADIVVGTLLGNAGMQGHAHA